MLDNFNNSFGKHNSNLVCSLLSQVYCCSTCREPPEAHEYSYTHQNGNLTVIVEHLDQKHHMSGENEENIWMWALCLRCKDETGIGTVTPRVVMSKLARNLSFGKFLELSFSSQFAVRRLSRCSHLLHQDCLMFFGYVLLFDITCMVVL
jgi:1-phosphatidylinositol-3-phosphate 5-kinase